MRLSNAARRDWLQLSLMCSIMLMSLQELCKSCRVRVILFYFIANGRTALTMSVMRYN